MTLEYVDPHQGGRGFESPANTHEPLPDTEPSTRKSVAVGVDDAAALMGVGVSTVYRLLKRGELTRLKLGHRTLIRLSEIEAFIDRLAVEPVS